MKKVYVAVMDYSSGCIKMYTLELTDNWQTEDVENWLYAHTDYNDSQCYYMASENEIGVEYES